MTAPHPFFAQSVAWRDLVVTGRKDVIDRFLEYIDGHLPDGWEPNPEAERRAAGVGVSTPRSRCYRRRLAGRDVWLWLYRPGDCRVQGGLVEPTAHTHFQDDVAGAIGDFRRLVLEPAAAAVGLRVGRARPGPQSSVPTAVMDAFWEYAERSQCQWPPPPPALRAWKEFVAQAYQDQVPLARDEFSGWLVEQGWDPVLAGGLVTGYYDALAAIDDPDPIRRPA